LETQEFDLEGEVIFCDTIRAITDASAGLVSVVTRQSPQSARVLSATCPIDANGLSGIVVEARYMRGRLEIPAGSTWSYARGLQPVIQPGGEF
jgi:hypothetical protein